MENLRVTNPGDEDYPLNLVAMEKKKQPGRDVHRQARLFRSIGFTISLLIIIMAFEWRTRHDPMIDLRQLNVDVPADILDVPVTELIPPKPLPRPVTFIETTEEDPDPVDVPPFDMQKEYSPEIPVDFTDPAPEEETDIPFTLVEESAAPQGGLPAFYTFVSDQLSGKYPAVARRMGIEGRVFVEFIVERDGSLTSVRVIKGIGGGCDELASRILQASPPWNPGRQRGKPVRQKMIIPIFFKLN